MPGCDGDDVIGASMSYTSSILSSLTRAAAYKSQARSNFRRTPAVCCCTGAGCCDDGLADETSSRAWADTSMTGSLTVIALEKLLYMYLQTQQTSQRPVTDKQRDIDVIVRQHWTAHVRGATGVTATSLSFSETSTSSAATCKRVKQTDVPRHPH